MEGSVHEDPGAPSDPPSDGTAAIMDELKARLQATDSRFDSLTRRLDRMNKRTDRYTTRLDGPEHRISEAEDGHTNKQENLERVEVSRKW
ncbi:hypothetical protein NDU88_002162 [Pleurodeles waltl]|uniref:t-SNARE coiled-coil homology domain-containing protein n=1 Tax=Pleurodeles waltl TaxID=8319 RepID=A0AAV7W2K5_PLEWA|nr:hypothetical protein NDU88_002162 [Pleurodeles waltl]